MTIRFIDGEQVPAQSAKPKIRFIDPEPKQSVFGAVGKALSNRPELQPYGDPSDERTGNPIQDALSFARETVTAPIRVGNTLNVGPQVAGRVAEQAGEEFGHPTLGKVAGKAIEYGPLAMGAGGAISALRKSANPWARGATGQFNKAFREGEAAAGITDQLPVQRGAMARFPPVERVAPTKQPIPIEKAQPLPSIKPVSYPKDTPSFVNFAKARMKAFGKRLTPQEVDDYAKVSTNLLDKMQSQGMGRTPLFAAVADTKTMAVALRNQVIPGRAELNTAFKVMTAPRRTIAKTGKAAGKVIKSPFGQAAGGLGLGAYVAKKIWGQ